MTTEAIRQAGFGIYGIQTFLYSRIMVGYRKDACMATLVVALKLTSSQGADGALQYRNRSFHWPGGLGISNAGLPSLGEAGIGFAAGSEQATGVPCLCVETNYT